MAENSIPEKLERHTLRCVVDFDGRRQEMLRSWRELCQADPRNTQTEIDNTMRAMQTIAAIARNAR